MIESEKYKLSTYQTTEILRCKEDSIVETVESSLDGKKYIKKTYHEDKRAIYRLLSDIESDSLATIQEVFFGEDTIIIEQYVAGKTLQQLITEKHSFSREDIRKIFDSLTEGISSLHRKNIIHRDIKPSNIIITPEGKAVLIDYGIARIHTAKKADDTEYYGTAGYAAPEQFGFRQSDFRTDIYALGMTLKQIVTSHNASKAMLKAIDKCAEFAPERRFRTVDEMREQLAQEEKRRRNILCLCVAVVVCVLIGTWIWSSEHTLSEEIDATAIAPTEQMQETKKELMEEITESNIVKETDKKQTEMKRQTVEEVKIHLSDKLGAHSELVDLMNSDGKVRCLSLKAGKQTISIDLGNGRSTHISAERRDASLLVTINKTISFIFTDDSSLSRTSYPQGSMMAELVFYDMNGDGTFEIIPIISNAVRARGGDGSITVLKNYSLGWCIYSNGKTYIRAENRMTALLDTFKIYASALGCIWTDFPAYYKLIDGRLVLCQ